MRTVQVTHLFLPHVGGIEFYVYRLARDLAAGGDRSIVISSTASGEEGERQMDGFGASYLKSLKLLPRNFLLVGMKSKLAEIRPDVVHIHSIWFIPSLQAALMKKIFGYKLINTIHGVWPDNASFAVKIFVRIFKPIANFVVSRSDKIIVLTKSEKAKLLQHFRVNEDKVSVIGNGIDEVLVDKQLVEQTKRQFGSRILLFTGRIIPDKNPQLLIEAFNHIGRTHPETSLLFVGPVEPQYRQTLLLGASESLRARIHFAGSVDPQKEPQRLASYYAASALSVAIGSWEGLPTRALESMVQSTPVVAYRSGGTAEAIQDGQSGYLINDLDSKQLLAKLETFLAQSESQRQRLRDSARQGVKKYLWSAIFKQIHAAY